MDTLKTFMPLIVLIVTWLVGQRFIVFWDLRKKQRELDIAAAERFQNLYGDLKEVGRLWRYMKSPKNESLRAPNALGWTLLEKVVAAEGQYEAFVIKMATERGMSSDQLETLGLFRQAVQEIRDSIRQGREIPAGVFGGEYLAFNDLAAEITCMLAGDSGSKAADQRVAKRNLEQIALVRKADWRRMARNYLEHRVPAIRDDGAPGRINRMPEARVVGEGITRSGDMLTSGN